MDDAREQFPLHTAAFDGRTGTVKSLLAAGADPSRLDRNGLSALGLAIAHGHVDVVRAFIENGVDLDHAQHAPGGATALHLAAVHGTPEVVSLICLGGADVNAANGGGWAPLHMAREVGVVRAL